VRREAFHRERPGDADAGFVLIRSVVEQFDIGGAGDGGVNLALAGDTGFPPGGVRGAGGFRPGRVGLAGDFPLLKSLPLVGRVARSAG